MIKVILRILLILILVLLQLVLFNKFSIYGVIPNIILILAVALMIRGRYDYALIIGLGGSLFLDLTSPLRFGAYTFTTIIILLLLIYLINKYIPSPSYFTTFIIYFIVFLFFDLFFFLLMKKIPPWQIIFDCFIQSIWGIVIFVLTQDIIKAKEELEVS